MKRVVPFVCSSVLCIFVFVYGFHVQSEKVYRQSAQEGLTWLFQYEEDYKNPGVFWVLKDVNTRFCRSNEFEKKIDERFESVPRTSVERAYYYFPNSPISEETLASSTIVRYDRWLLETLACRERPLSLETRAELGSAELLRGYDATHAYLAVLYLERLGCSLDTESEDISLRERIIQTEEALMKEAAQDFEFSDLWVERAAFLLWGGRQDVVDEVWLEKITNAENPSGGWGDGVGTVSNPHSTALATWTLVQATGQCPL